MYMCQTFVLKHNYDERDPGDATSKVSCCVQTSYCFKNSDFDAIVKVPEALPLKMSLSRKREYGKS